MKKALSDFFTHPKIQEKINSEQFDLSRNLIKKRLKLDSGIDKMSKITGFDRDYYLKMEYGDLDVPITDFHIALRKINQHEKKLKENHYIINKTFQTSYTISYSKKSKDSFNPRPTNFELKVA